MSNSIIKNETVEYAGSHIITVGDVYEPPTPPRTVYETRTVCGFHYSVPGHYNYVTDPVTFVVRKVFVPDDPATIGGTSGVYKCAIESVPVTYPGTPGRAASPTFYSADYVTGYNLGFNSGGRSKAFFTANGYAEFKVRKSAVGVIVGLNCYDGVDSGYSGRTIDYAFYCARGIAYIIENGAIGAAVGAYTDATLFRVSRTSTTITYTMAGVTVKTTTGALTTAAKLEAALYSAGDEVFDPVIVQVSSPDTSSKGSTLLITLPPMAMMMADGPYADLHIELPPMALGFDYGLVTPDYSLLYIELPYLAFDANSLTGEIAQLAVTLPPVEMLFADHPYGELRIVLPPLGMTLDATEGPYRASMQGLAGAGSTIRPSKLAIVTMVTGANAFGVMQRGRRVSVEIVSGAVLHGVLNLHTVQQAVMRSVAAATALTGVPSGEMETWVINMEGFGSTTYSAYDFNSFARIGDQFYGSKAGGIFSLDGDDDEGDPIRAMLDFGERDFGSSVKKTVSEVFAGVSSQGNLFLKVIADGQEYLFKTDNVTDEMQQQRVKLAKGIKASYTGLVLYNQDGQDFEIDTVEFMVADMTRKL